MDRRRLLKSAAAASAWSSVLPGAEAPAPLVKATEAVLAAVPRAEADPERPVREDRDAAEQVLDGRLGGKGEGESTNPQAGDEPQCRDSDIVGAVDDDGADQVHPDVLRRDASQN